MAQPTERIGTSAAERLGAFYETRAAAAFAYCSRLCPAERIAAAVEAAFAAAGEARATDGTLDARLRTACRRAAAENAASAGGGEYCDVVPRLLVARVQGELYEAEDATLREHLARCDGCRAFADDFAEAERVFDALLPSAPPGGDASPTGAAPAEPPAPAPRAATDEQPAAAADVLRPEPGASLPRAAAMLRALPRPHLGAAGRRHLSALLLVLGLLLIAEAVTTVVWKEPFTSYLASRAQAALRGELAKLDATERRSIAATAAAPRHTAEPLTLVAAKLNARVRQGRALGWIEIPKIGVDYVFVQGTGAASLRKGPAHYLKTPLPGAGGTVGIAGHRTTYLAPFRDIDALHRGDRIVIRMPYGRFTYLVEGHRIVPANVTDAFRPLGYERVVLSACHPLYSASHRILVSARLVGTRPLTAPAPSAARRARAEQQDLAALGARPLALGATGPDVRELQRLLGVPTTGYFGYETQSAVVDFARSHALDPSGAVDEAFKRALAHRGGPPGTPPTPPAVAPQPPPAQRAPAPPGR